MNNLTLIAASIFFLFRKISLAEIKAHIIIGAEKVISLILMLVQSWALVMPTAVTFSISSGVNISMMVGAVWAGGASICKRVFAGGHPVKITKRAPIQGRVLLGI